MHDVYEIIIIGGGPAGMTAALYASRARMKALLVEMGLCGGQILIADTIENFPGFPEGVKGPELAGWMFKQAEHFGLELKTSEVKAVVSSGDKGGCFEVEMEDGRKVRSLSLIVATGAKWNALAVPGEKKLEGKGVSYCATCDGPLFRGKSVVVVGGGDTALEDAIFLTKFADKVTVVHRRDKLRATKILQERARGNKKIEFKLNSVITEIKGAGRVESVEIMDVTTEKRSEISSGGVFVLIGMSPNSGVVSHLVKTDELGHILTDDEMRTSARGIFACGDVRKKLLRQIVTAAGDGAIAAFSAEHYVESLKISREMMID